MRLERPFLRGLTYPGIPEMTTHPSLRKYDLNGFYRNRRATYHISIESYNS